MGITLLRIVVGFAISFFIGTGLATLFAGTKLSEQLSAMVQAFQVIPAVTVGVILVIIFGVGSAPPIILITLMTLPLVFMNTLQALKFPDPPKLLEYLDSIKADRKLRFSALMKPPKSSKLPAPISFWASAWRPKLLLPENLSARRTD